MIASTIITTFYRNWCTRLNLEQKSSSKFIHTFIDFSSSSVPPHNSGLNFSHSLTSDNNKNVAHSRDM